jgi:hypothetical protein
MQNKLPGVPDSKLSEDETYDTVKDPKKLGAEIRDLRQWAGHVFLILQDIATEVDSLKETLKELLD